MMTDSDLVESLLQREGETPVADSDGVWSKWGIRADSWGRYEQLGRQATRAEVEAITRDQAAMFYQAVYVTSSPFAVVSYDPLRVQLIDFAVNSGSARATRWLQRVLRVPVTGWFNQETKTALNLYPGWLICNALAAMRGHMMLATIADDPAKAGNEKGWLRRALSFVDVPPEESA